MNWVLLHKNQPRKMLNFEKCWHFKGRTESCFTRINNKKKVNFEPFKSTIFRESFLLNLTQLHQHLTKIPSIHHLKTPTQTL